MNYLTCCWLVEMVNIFLCIFILFILLHLPVHYAQTPRGEWHTLTVCDNVWMYANNRLLRDVAGWNLTSLKIHSLSIYEERYAAYLNEELIYLWRKKNIIAQVYLKIIIQCNSEAIFKNTALSMTQIAP